METISNLTDLLKRHVDSETSDEEPNYTIELLVDRYDRGSLLNLKLS